jgi:hypothetical protein
MKKTNTMLSVVFVCVACQIAAASQGAFRQLGALQPSNAGPSDYFGYWLAMSGDVIVANGNGGECVFVKPSGGWRSMKETATLTASDGTLLHSVSISGDTIVAAGENGAAYVFVKPSTGWANMTQSAKLMATDAGFGFSEVSVGGSTIIAGAPDAQIGSNQNQGAAYVFVEPVGGWVDMTQTAKLTAADGAANDNLGYASAIDGGTVVVGAPYATILNGGDYNQGAAYIFTEPAAGWTDMTATAKLTASDGTSVANLGYSVAVQGNTAVAGAPNQLDPNGFGGGAAYIYVEPTEGWIDTTETAQLSPSNAVQYGSAGYSVAIRGNLVLVGSPGMATLTKRQTTYSFLKPSQGWNNMTQTAAIKPSALGYIEFGHSVGSVSTTVVVGAPGSVYTGYEGIVYVYGQ